MQKFFFKKKTWLKLGNQNIGFFHRVHQIFAECRWCQAEDLETIKELVVSYYKKLLGQLPSQLYNSDIARITNFFTHKIFLQAKGTAAGWGNCL